jgi:transcriptional regulator with XRE-family HTH domain
VPAIEPFYKDLGKRLQDARERAGLTQKEVADRLVPPVTRASVANMESGKQRVLCHTLVALSGVLSTTPERLLVGAVAAPPREAKASKEPLKVIEVIENELQRKVGRDVTANILTKLDARRA